MLEIVYITAIVLVVALIIWSVLTSKKLGTFIYHKGLPFEAVLYGFKLNKIDIIELSLSVYDNESADKPTIVMLHGYTANKNVWVRFAKHLSKDYRIVIPDMAGHGDTEFRSGSDFGITKQTERVLALIDALKIDKVHIIGNSMGGFIGATFAKNYPNRTISAALVDPAGVRSPKASEMEEMVVGGKNPFLISNDKEFKHFYAMTMERPPFAPQIVLNVVSEIYQTRRRQYAEIFSDFQQSEMLDKTLDQITVPVLLFWGGKDRILHVSAVDIWQAGIPNIEVTTWPEIGHMPMMEIPKESAQRYINFLNNL